MSTRQELCIQPRIYISTTGFQRSKYTEGVAVRMRTCIAVQKLIRLKVRPKIKIKKNYARASEVNGFPNHANWVMVEDLDPLIHIMAERSNDISDSGRFVQNVYQKIRR